MSPFHVRPLLGDEAIADLIDVDPAHMAVSPAIPPACDDPVAAGDQLFGFEDGAGRGLENSVQAARTAAWPT